MNNSIYTPIYINKNLVLDLYSILINGYIESKTIRYSQDNINTLKLQKGKKSVISGGKKKVNNNKEKNITRDKALNCTDDFTMGFDNREGMKNETSIKQIYSTFQIFYNLKNIMLEKKMLRCISWENIANSNLQTQEFIEFEGNIEPTSILSQINTTIDILEAYDTKNLDKLLEKGDGKKEQLTTYSVILKQLKNLSVGLTKNNTTYMVLDCNCYKAILNVNLNDFLDKTTYIYDYVNCSCKVLCRVVNIVDKNETIDLFCKTCMENYYSDFIKQMHIYLDLLKEENILVPTEIMHNIQGPAIQVIPIAMYV